MSTNNTFKKYRVVKEIYPSGRVRYEQDLSDEDVEARTATYKVGEYSTLQQAQKAAKKARDRTGQFDGWAEEFYLLVSVENHTKLEMFNPSPPRSCLYDYCTR